MSSLTITERNAQICDEFYRLGQSSGSLAKKHGLAVSTIGKIIRAGKVDGMTRAHTRRQSPDVRCRENWKTLSSVHHRLGVLVNRYMTSEGLNNTAFASLVGMSRFSVGMLQQGAADISLVTFLKICEVIEVPPAEIMTLGTFRNALQEFANAATSP